MKKISKKAVLRELHSKNLGIGILKKQIDEIANEKRAVDESLRECVAQQAALKREIVGLEAIVKYLESKLEPKPKTQNYAPVTFGPTPIKAETRHAVSFLSGFAHDKK